MIPMFEPDAKGHFGNYGGRFVPETLMAPLQELETAYRHFQRSPEMQGAFRSALAHYVGRPSPLYEARRLSKYAGGARILLKREDLLHTGAHKINNAVGQALLAKSMGKTRLIAETGAGQHGVATSTVAAWLGMECCIFMGTRDIERQKVNVYRMRLLGAQVIPVTAGSATLKDAMNEAMRDWVTQIDHTYYLVGTVAGPHPYPEMVRNFQSVIGQEVRDQSQIMPLGHPDAMVACIGGGSNAIGLFYPFLETKAVALYGVEAAGEGIESQRHAASIAMGRSGVLHGNRTYLLQTEGGQIIETHSISAGLDYPGVGPEHAWLHDVGRVHYVSIDDEEALASFHRLTRLEGIMPALESAHALAYAERLAADMAPHQTLVVNLSGRGDKDITTVSTREGLEL